MEIYKQISSMRILLPFIFLLTFQNAFAQEYRVYSDRKDSFSVALVRLLKCAENRFRDCKGDSIRTTWLMGTDYRLSFDFPGSSMAIVRKRDYDVNAYIEFRGFKDYESREAGIRKIIARIKHCFGDRLNDRYGDTARNVYFYGLSLKDEYGYFQMNMELFGSSSTAPVYLLGPEREIEEGIKQHFILLKIYPGVPNYFNYIRNETTPDPILDKTIKRLIALAENDFDSLQVRKTGGKIKRRDTLSLNNVPVLMDFSGTYRAILEFPLRNGNNDFKNQWEHYQQVLRSALGSGYHYYKYKQGIKEFVTYFGSTPEHKHRITLESYQEGEKPVIMLVIPSLIDKPRKAGLDFEDPDE